MTFHMDAAIEVALEVHKIIFQMMKASECVVMSCQEVSISLGKGIN